MAKNDEQTIDLDSSTTKAQSADDATPAGSELTTFEKMKRQASEGDEAPTASMRFRDILGGDYLWAAVRHHIWLIMLIVFIVTAYVAVRYQCQQDAIDISQLEKDLVDAKFQSLSSSSNLTRICRQSSIEQLLRQFNDSTLVESDRPPFIIEVPE